jgi:NTP pyrophosphatase (non-canonical NTP hydrolase)
MAPGIHLDKVKTETMHGIVGVAGEAGELLDAMKKAVFYGHKLDRENLKEECGDLLWYLTAIIRSEGWSFEEVMLENIAKLRQRYPEQFSSDLAAARLDKI